MCVDVFSVHSCVEHVITHVLFSCTPACLSSHSTDSLKCEDFILKVNDRSEYFLK